MKGFILAAGFGTRLRPLTGNIPKALVNTCGKPTLERAIEILQNAGINEIAVNSHYLAEQIESYRTSSLFEFDIFFEPKILGTGGALRNAKNFLSEDDSFVVVNADIISNVDIKKLKEDFLSSDSACRLISAPKIKKGTVVSDIYTSEYLGVAPDFDSNTSKYLFSDFIGMTFYRKEFLEFLQDDTFSIVPLWQYASKRGCVVDVSVVKDIYWQDTGTPVRLLKLHKDFMDGRIKLSVPEYMNVDFERKIAVHSESNMYVSGSYVWSEVPDISGKYKISDSIIFSGRPHTSDTINNEIFTEWGRIKIENGQ